MRYKMQYLKTANVNLVKDMGMIPYLLHKKFGYDSTVVTYKNGEYSYLDNEVKGLNIDFVKKIFNSYSLDGVLYLLRNGRNIDFLQIFHVTISSVLYAFTYKLVNKKGKIYLKLDCSHKLVERINGLGSVQLNLLNKFFNKIDLISVEQEVLYTKLKEILDKQKDKIIILPNGIEFDKLDESGLKYDFSKKENTILNVARIGTEEKDTPMLLEAFAKIKDIEKSDWKLKLIGTVEEDFKGYIKDYFNKYPHLVNKVDFLGPIVDRKQLYEEFGKSKIFSLTSQFESFGIVFIEAAAMGNVIVSTDVGIAKELVSDDCGELVSSGDINALTEALSYYIKREDLEKCAYETYKKCREKFDWDNIVNKLNENIEIIMKQ